MNITNDMIVDAVENYFQDIHYAVVECDYNVIVNNILSNIAKQIIPEIVKQTKIKKIKMLLQNGIFIKLIDYKVYESVFNSLDKNVNKSSVLITSKQIIYDFTCIINEFFEENTHIKFIYAMLLNDEQHGPIKYISVGTNENSYVFGIVEYKPEEANENGFCCASIVLINRDGDNYKEFIERKLNKLTGGNEMVNDKSLNEKEKVKKINPADVQDENGNTLLHEAVWNGKYDIIKNLLEQGANPNIMNKNGETPIIKTFSGSCYRRCNKKVFKLLLEHGAEIESVSETLINEVIKLDSSDDRTELLNILLPRSKRFHIKKIYGETTTILHLATEYCVEGIVNEIMNKAKNGEYDDYEEN